MSPAKVPEAFSRVVIDAQLRDAKWNLTDGRSVQYEYVLSDGTKADYVLGDRHGRALSVVEAKRQSIDALGAEKQVRDYAIRTARRWPSLPGCLIDERLVIISPGTKIQSECP